WSKSDSFEDASSEMEDFLDLNSLHFGIEYLLMSGDAVLPLRVGYYTKPLFLTWDEDGDQVVNGVLALGAGLVMNNIIIDASMEFEPQTSFAGYDYYGDPVDLKRKMFRITIGATFHFGG
ncbi:MAG: hypothetical protein KAR38_17815, partial [Calditrichia bacterium]|nr:hypothetical protein [Calditrichia bacterium]